MHIVVPILNLLFDNYCHYYYYYYYYYSCCCCCDCTVFWCI